MRGLGLFIGIEFVTDRETLSPDAKITEVCARDYKGERQREKRSLLMQRLQRSLRERLDDTLCGVRESERDRETERPSVLITEETDDTL